MLQWLYNVLFPGPAQPAPPAAPGPVLGQPGPPALPAVVPAAPVAGVIPPPVPFPVVHPPVDPAAERRQREVATFLVEIRQRENAVGGHVVARHHPDLTDQQLQDRLTTGLDEQGHVAATSGVSSAFASREIFEQTMRRVEELLNQGIENTRAYLRPNLDAYRQARAAADAAQQAALPNALGAANPAMAAFRQAKNDLLAAIGVTQQGTIVNHAFMIPVEAFELPPIANRHQWAPSLQRYIAIRLFPRYSVVVDHGRSLGRGFRGTSPRQKIVNGQQITTYAVVLPFQGPSDHTFTLLVVRGQHDLRLDRPHNARDWGVRTHFPTNTRQESITWSH